MPNHVENVWTISVNEERVQDVKDIMVDKDTGRITFAKIIPMPEILRYIHDGSCTIDGEQVEYWMVEDKNGVRLGNAEWLPDTETIERKLTAKEEAELEKIGFKSWYDWSIENWGTKWSAYGDQHVSTDKYRVHLRFDTAWSPPMQVAEALARHFSAPEDDHDKWFTLDGFYGGEVDEPGAFRLHGDFTDD